LESRRSSDPLLFTTTDFFGNSIILKTKTWELHILDEHPEMAGYEKMVQGVVEQPEQIRISTDYDSGLAFISSPGVGPRPEGIRVLVDYADTFYEKGASFGVVATAYPIDWIKYGHPKLGKTIYRRGGGK